VKVIHEVAIMQLEDYFDFQGEDDIRIKGHRIGIESILYEYIHRKQTPEQIQKRFPSISVEQIHATILYYLQNKARITEYITDWLKWNRKMEEEQDKNPPPVVVRIRKIITQKRTTRANKAHA
jgi:uncharacterized protein (DUF433 family)